MKYLVCQNYSITSNNHAGMKHMCNLLKKNYPDEYEVIIFPDLYKDLSKNKFIKRVQCFVVKKVLVPYKYLIIGKKLKDKLKKKDTVFLLEYCELLFPQLVLAEYLKKKSRDVTIYGLVHLVPQKLDNSFTESQFQKWLNPVDSILTLGSSLSNYFINTLSIPRHKVKMLFHYVDLDYYKPKINTDIIIKDKFIPKVLAMGNQKRNFELLLKIVKNNPETQFTICQGVMDLKEQFIGCENVELIGFVEESELLVIMQNSDISLNIMDDTVGSNVITSSMAVGLAIIVSDVGSIKDYCKNDGAIYCNNNEPQSFSQSIKELFANQDKLEKLKAKSLEYSKNYSIHHFNDLVNSIQEV